MYSNPLPLDATNQHATTVPESDTHEITGSLTLSPTIQAFSDLSDSLNLMNSVTFTVTLQETTPLSRNVLEVVNRIKGHCLEK